MANVDTFIKDLETKALGSLDTVVGNCVAGLTKEGLGTTELILLDVKTAIEAADAAAIWITDADDLGLKMSLASHCGDRARQYHQLVERLQALGMDVSTYDPRHGGYTKLFAFLRSVQTNEERASALFALGRFGIRRAAAMVHWCRERGDEGTSLVYEHVILPDERKREQSGEEALMRAAANEETQARARRAAYRIVELLNEVHDAALIKKTLARMRK